MSLTRREMRLRIDSSTLASRKVFAALFDPLLCSFVGSAEGEHSSFAAQSASKSHSTPNLSAWRGTAGGGGKFLTEKETVSSATQQQQKPRNLILNAVFGQEDDYEKKLESSAIMPYRKSKNPAKPVEKPQAISNQTHSTGSEKKNAAPKPKPQATVGPKACRPALDSRFSIIRLWLDFNLSEAKLVRSLRTNERSMKNRWTEPRAN